MIYLLWFRIVHRCLLCINTSHSAKLISRIYNIVVCVVNLSLTNSDVLWHHNHAIYTIYSRFNAWFSIKCIVFRNIDCHHQTITELIPFLLMKTVNSVKGQLAPCRGKTCHAPATLTALSKRIGRYKRPKEAGLNDYGSPRLFTRALLAMPLSLAWVLSP